MDVLEVIHQGVFEPCDVELKVSDKDTRVFSCQTCLRLLPGRRLTALASSAGKKYVIKIFPQQRRSLNEYEKEIAGYELLHTASIDIPARIYHGPAQGKLNIIVYNYISRARTLSEVFSIKPGSRQQQSILAGFSQLLSRLHRAGLIHEDPHLANFLVKGDVITVLDAGAVRHVRNAALFEKNYGLFVAQFPVSWRLEQKIFEQYVFDKKADEKYHTRLEEQVKSRQLWREKHYLKKIYRECTAFHVRSFLFGKLIIDRDYIDSGLVELLDDPRRVFDGEGTILLKKGNSSTVGLIKINKVEYVIKRYNVKSPVHRIKNMLRESRASRSWRNAHSLLLRGLPTAKPIAMVDCVKGKLKGVSLFVMENVPGINSADYFRQKEINRDTMKIVASKMLLMINELHQERILHNDLKSTNFIIRKGEPVIIDLDAMRVVGGQGSIKSRIKKEMQRFDENWVSDGEAKSIFDELTQANSGERN